MIALDGVKTPAGTAWSALRLAHDPGLRVELLDWLVRSKVDIDVLVNRLDTEPDVSVRRQLIQTLGAFGHLQPHMNISDSLPARLVAMYRDDPDPGIHSSLAYLLRRWGMDRELELINADRSGKPREWRHWYVNPAGITMAVLDVPETNRPLPPEPGQPPERFAIATTETPLTLFQQFDRNHATRRNEHYNPAPPAHPDAPADTVSYFGAAHFCNWLSEREGIPQKEWCYRPGDAAGVWVLVPDYLSRLGYRLPTVQEWVYAARGGTSTDRYFGDDLAHIDDYSWHRENNPGHHPEPTRAPEAQRFRPVRRDRQSGRVVLQPDTDTMPLSIVQRERAQTGLCEARLQVQKGSSFTGAKVHQTVRERPTAKDEIWPDEAWVYTGFRIVKNVQ